MSELLLRRIDELVATRTLLSIETTLAARRYKASIIERRSSGYRVVLFFIWHHSAELAILKVAEHMRNGGPNIPDSMFAIDAPVG